MEREEILWTNYLPLHAAAKLGKVHLRVPGGWKTLCGVRVGRPRNQFPPSPDDARCQRCAKAAS